MSNRRVKKKRIFAKIAVIVIAAIVDSKRILVASDYTSLSNFSSSFLFPFSMIELREGRVDVFRDVGKTGSFVFENERVIRAVSDTGGEGNSVVVKRW